MHQESDLAPEKDDCQISLKQRDVVDIATHASILDKSTEITSFWSLECDDCTPYRWPRPARSL